MSDQTDPNAPTWHDANLTRKTIALAAFVAILVCAMFLILVRLGPEVTCEEYGYTPVVLEEGGGVVCIPWGTDE